jgi:hypothetical protein
MNQFENEVRESLRRRNPPKGFAERTLARIREAEVLKTPSRWNQLRSVLSSRGWRWAAVTSVLVLSVGLFTYSERARRLEGERAKEEVLFALRLTGSKLREIQEHVKRVQEHRIEIHLEKTVE